MTPAEEHRLQTIAWRVVKYWVGDTEYADILGETYLQAYLGYLKGLELGSAKPMHMAARRAAWGPAEWLRKWGGANRATLRRAAVQVEWEDISTLPAEGHEETIIEREYQAWLWREAESHWNEQQRTVMHRVLRLGETKRQCGAVLGVSEQRVGQVYQAAIKVCREWATL